MPTRYVDPNSPEGRTLSEDLDRTIAKIKEWAHQHGATSTEGIVITPEGPKSIDEDN